MPKDISSKQPPTSSNLRLISAKRGKSKSSPISFTAGSVSDYERGSESLSLLEDLEENKDRYKTPQGESTTITIISFATMFRSNLDRLQQQINYKPSRNSMVSACIYRGVSELRKNQLVKDLLSVQQRYKMVPSKVESEIYNIIGSLITLLPISSPKGSRVNVLIPRDICGMLSDLANDMGISNSSLSILTIMTALLGEESTIDDDREEMFRCVRSFHRSMGIRTRACSTLLETYGL